jgi:hypothetical protein
MHETAPPDTDEKPPAPCQQERGGVHSFVQTLALSSRWLFSLAIIGIGIIAVALFVLAFC